MFRISELASYYKECAKGIETAIHYTSFSNGVKREHS